MATKAKIAKNNRRKMLANRYRARRLELKKLMKDPQLSEEDQHSAFLELCKLPRDASPTRVRNRCKMCGRPRGYYRKFQLCRICLRKYALQGDVPGVTKSSW